MDTAKGAITKVSVNNNRDNQYIDIASEKTISQSQINQIKNGRTIGEKICRKIKSALTLPRYWFDMPEEDQERLIIDMKVLEIARAIKTLPSSQRAALRAALISPNVNAENM